jgi:very-long-chain enoyl-CoA reductase
LSEDVIQFAEVSNLHAHVTVRNLRPAGSKARAIPRGYLFDFVSFPNYFFESLAWASIAALSGSWAGKSLILMTYD